MLLGASNVACAGMVQGTVPPSTFQFESVVPLDKDPSGWKVAKVRILLGRISRTIPQTAYCDVEIGVPEVTHLGPVTTGFAQLKAAEASDAAARIVLSQGLSPTAILCAGFRKEMLRLLSVDIPGARVTAFITESVMHKTFP
jgi:hypothetical protein